MGSVCVPSLDFGMVFRVAYPCPHWLQCLNRRAARESRSNPAPHIGWFGLMAYQEDRGRRSRQTAGRSGTRYPRQSSGGYQSRGGYQSNYSSRTYNRSRSGNVQYQSKYQQSSSRGDRDGGRFANRRGSSRGVQKYSGSRSTYTNNQRVTNRTGRFNDSNKGRGGSAGSRGSRGFSRGSSRGRGRRGGRSGVPMTRE